jgi:hypothetical protein
LLNRFIGNDDSSLSQKIFDVSEAQGEAVVEPDGLANDRWRESISVMAE